MDAATSETTATVSTVPAKRTTAERTATKRKSTKRTKRPFGGTVMELGQRPGALYGRFFDPSIGKRVTVKLLDGTDAKARAKAEELLTDRIRKARSIDPASGEVRSVSLSAFLPEFYELAETRVGDRHLDALTNRLDRAAIHFGSTPMHRVSRATAETYLAKLSREDGRLEVIDVANADGTPKLDDKGKQVTRTITHPMSAGTVAIHRSALSACWAAAVDRNAATTNPWRQARVAKGQEFAPRLLTHAEVRRIVAHTPPQVRALVGFLAETGLRLSEAQQLTWQRVADDFGSVVVARSKSGRTRTVPTTAAAKTILQARWKVHVAPATGPDLVFDSRERSYVWHLFRRACLAAGVGRGVRLHDLRHYVGTSLAQANVAIPTIMRVLGHTQIATTQRYAAHLPANAAAEAFAALDAARAVTKKRKARKAKSA